MLDKHRNSQPYIQTYLLVFARRTTYPNTRAKLFYHISIKPKQKNYECKNCSRQKAQKINSITSAKKKSRCPEAGSQNSSCRTTQTYTAFKIGNLFLHLFSARIFAYVLATNPYMSLVSFKFLTNM